MVGDVQVRSACEANYEANKNNCSGFACAVAHAVEVPLAGLTNDIVDTIRRGGEWTELANGLAAAAAAASGKLVLAGLCGDEQATPSVHGHVAVIVSGAPYQGVYPYAYWGSDRGIPYENTPIDYAWTHPDLPKVTFAQHDIPAA